MEGYGDVLWEPKAREMDVPGVISLSHLQHVIPPTLPQASKIPLFRVESNIL